MCAAHAQGLRGMPRRVRTAAGRTGAWPRARTAAGGLRRAPLPPHKRPSRPLAFPPLASPPVPSPPLVSPPLPFHPLLSPPPGYATRQARRWAQSGAPSASRSCGSTRRTRRRKSQRHASWRSSGYSTSRWGGTPTCAASAWSRRRWGPAAGARALGSGAWALACAPGCGPGAEPAPRRRPFPLRFARPGRPTPAAAAPAARAPTCRWTLPRRCPPAPRCRSCGARCWTRRRPCLRCVPARGAPGLGGLETHGGSAAGGVAASASVRRLPSLRRHTCVVPPPQPPGPPPPSPRPALPRALRAAQPRRRRGGGRAVRGVRREQRAAEARGGVRARPAAGAPGPAQQLPRPRPPAPWSGRGSLGPLLAARPRICPASGVPHEAEPASRRVPC